MSDVDVLPELKQIVGALLFVAKQPLSLDDIRRVLVQVAESWGGVTKDYAQASEENIRAAMDELRAILDEKKLGIRVEEIADGYRLENDAACGPWLRNLLERGRPTRLSRPALETLAIIAYRQPVVRSDIEKVRGVAVDQILRNLLEMQLIRIVGRSELPGRPWMFGTTQKFLEHFGLKNLDELPGIEELRKMEIEQIRREEERAALSAGAEGSSGDGETEETEGEQGLEAGGEEETVKKSKVASKKVVAEVEPEEKERDEDVEEEEEEEIDEEEEVDEESDDEEFDDDGDEEDEEEGDRY